jgi:transketolase
VTTAPLVGSLDTASFDANAIAIIRGFAMDAPFYAKSGHQGTAMTLAPLAHVLYSRVMNHNPADPLWMNRDRFILSNGHASILQYANLFLNGYGLELGDIKAFRQLGSLTPGHPEVGHTSGVEVTTGPLGQGFANAVGMAIAESHLRSQLGSDLVDHHTYVVVGDGCLMEGVSHEAASLAGHLKLDHLVVIFDDNKITIDGALDLTCSDNVADRFRSYQWNVIECGDISQDCDALEKVLLQARAHVGQPTLIVLPTRIGFPSPDFTDKHAAHGNPFTEEHIARTKEVIGMPNEAFWAPANIVQQHREHALIRCKVAYSDWQNKSAKKSSDIAAYASKDYAQTMSSVLPVFGNDESPATRVAIQKVLEEAAKVLPQLISGAADLTGNTGAKLSGEQAFSASNPAGKQLYYGIREHAMGSIANGMALHGMVLPVVGTFFVFADYMRPSLRLAALSKAKVVFIFSHDSVGVGEDGPTHQPVEQLASLRIIPGLQVIRPCDGNETAAAWMQALSFDGPTALILSRQNLPIVTDGSAVRTGAAIIRSVDEPDLVLVGTGSEVSVCLEAAEILASRGVSANVVSAPCFSLFDSQSDEYRDQVLPHDLPIIGVEAGVASGWEKYVDDMVSIESFGTSAPGAQALEHFGISASNVAERAIQLHS